MRLFSSFFPPLFLSQTISHPMSFLRIPQILGRGGMGWVGCGYHLYIGIALHNSRGYTDLGGSSEVDGRCTALLYYLTIILVNKCRRDDHSRVDLSPVSLDQSETQTQYHSDVKKKLKTKRCCIA
jgi:hypothetical protein